MALPQEFDLKLYAGDTERFVIRWKEENGIQRDLTDAVIELGIVQKRSEGTVKLVEGIVTDIGTLAQEIVFTFSDSDTDDLLGDGELARKTYMYDVQITYPDSVITLVRGKCYVYSDVTQTVRTP